MDLHIHLIRIRLARRARATRWLAAALVALLAPMLLLTPPSASAASTSMVAACAGVNVRTGTSTGSTARTQLATNARVTVVTKVSGSSWRATCPSATSGSSWYRISAINGKSVTSLYGVTYLYAATGVLKAAPASVPAPTRTADPFGDALTRLLNLDRVALGKPAYLVDARLAEIARNAAFTCPTNAAMHLRGRAQDLATRRYLTHTVPGCYQSGTTTPYRSLTIVRTVFGYTRARSEILHWNGYGTAPTAYRLGCDINGAKCAGGTTTAPYTVTLAQRNFMSSAPHRAAELNSYQRVGCGSAKGSGRTYFACLFADGGPTPTPSPKPPPSASAASTSMVAACAGVNVRTGTSTGSTARTQLATNARVTVVTKVSGSSWRATCPSATSGSSWYRISAINGKSVTSLYGVTYLYAATGVLKAAPAH